MMTRARKDEAGMRTKLVTADRERQDLAMHLARSHAEKASLRQQACIRLYIYFGELII
jgi:hypothetical protein